MGPHEDVAKLFLMDSNTTQEVSSEVAQFLNLSLVECRAILEQYYVQEEREVIKVKAKYVNILKDFISGIYLFFLLKVWGNEATDSPLYAKIKAFLSVE